MRQRRGPHGPAAAVALCAALAAGCTSPEAPPEVEDAVDADGTDADAGTAADGDPDDGDVDSGDVDGSDPGGTDVDGDGTATGALERDLVFGRSSGFTGRIDELTVAPDGAAELTTTGEEDVSFRLTDDELADVAAALEGAALADAPDDAMSDPPIADAPTYEVVYGDDQVLTDEFAAPDELRPLFEVLGALIDRERGA